MLDKYFWCQKKEKIKSNWTETTSKKIDILEKKNSDDEKIKKTWKKLNMYLKIIFVMQNDNACIFFHMNIWLFFYDDSEIWSHLSANTM